MYFKLTYTDSSQTVNLHPTWNYLDSKKLLRKTASTLTFNMITYKWGTAEEWIIPVDFISSNDANLVNNWWANQYVLLYEVNSYYYNVRISGDESPIQQLVKPYQFYTKGVIKLEQAG